MKTRKLENFKLKRGHQLPQSLLKSTMLGIIIQQQPVYSEEYTAKVASTKCKSGQNKMRAISTTGERCGAAVLLGCEMIDVYIV